MSAYANIEELHADLRACRLCAEAGHAIHSTPIFSGPASARLMLIGQAPGATEPALGYPFGGEASQRLFRWLARAGWDERSFRATCYITSVTKCFPGSSPNGSGDRVPGAAERKLCWRWLEAELALVQPEVVVPVGTLAIKLFYPRDVKLADVIGGSRIDEQGRLIIPLPHPSGTSRWFNEPRNQGRLERALYRLKAAKAERGL
jgi:uracil-DNA glycosylase